MVRSLRRSGVAQQPSDAVGQPRPALALELELAAALRRDGVDAGRAVALGQAPPALEQAVLGHAVQRRIERPLLDPEQLVRPALDVLGDGVAVQRAAGREGLEYEEGEGALKDVVLPRTAHRGIPIYA